MGDGVRGVLAALTLDNLHLQLRGNYSGKVILRQKIKVQDSN